MEYSAPRDLMEYGVLASTGGMGVLEYGVKLEYWSMEYGVWSIENFRRLRRADMRRLAAMITFCLGEAREKKRLLTFLFEKMEYGVLEYGAVGATEYGVLPASGRPGAMEYWSTVGRRPAGAAEYWSIGPAILLAGGQHGVAPAQASAARPVLMCEHGGARRARPTPRCTSCRAAAPPS